MKEFLMFFIPKRINHIVWFAPFAIAVGIYGLTEGYTETGMGSIVGGGGLALLYFVNRIVNADRIRPKQGENPIER